ncbi:uncharacterized protein [Dermacentor albipictus]|uniref:uncharacterized protein isoform X1 n=1 Tax=Dermacentor albipictus TaxID=60249 RepID=UPI0031FD1DFA
MLHETLHESNQPTERASRRPRPLQPLCSPSRVPGCEGTPAQDVNGAVMTSADQRRCASDVVETARSGRRPTEFPSGCVGATRSAAGLLATSSSASATMTPRRAALWDPHAALPGNSNVLPCFWFRHERLRSCRVMRASTNQLSLRLPGRHKDCSRSPGHVFQRKCHHDAISGCTLGSAGAAGGHSSILPCFWLRVPTCRRAGLRRRCGGCPMPENRTQQQHHEQRAVRRVHRLMRLFHLQRSSVAKRGHVAYSFSRKSTRARPGRLC